MYRFFISLAFVAFSAPIFSQTQLSGVLNHYTKILEIDFCSGKVTTTGASDFQEGERVIVMQMQGALINETNSANFGNVTDLQSAGFYEAHHIDSISGNEIFFENVFLHELNPQGSLQIVSYPTFEDAVITDTLSAQPWDGSTGGVLALEVIGQLTLEADIDLSHTGFRGGALNILTSGCNFLQNNDGYFYALSNWRGAPKGEGIAEIILGKEQGRGAQANGGGGGNDHNSGGGGGSNHSGGGIGGKQNVGNFGCEGNFPGKGGVALAPATERLFMGGGGGAGHSDDLGAGTPGGNGGGIVLLQAGSIAGNGNFIRSNGQTPSLNNGDGAGGAGAGGTIVLIANNLSGSLHIEAKGGDGGTVQNPPERCLGAGGGGAGGRLLTQLAGFASVQLNGGTAGVNLTPSNQCNGASNGATNGADGVQAETTEIPLATGLFPSLDLQVQSPVILACEGEMLLLPVSAQGVETNSFHWQINTGNGWVNLQNGTEYGGVTTPDLVVFSANAATQNVSFRLTAESNYCGEVVSAAIIIEVSPLPTAAFLVVPQGGSIFQFVNQSLNANAYLWDFGDGTTSAEPTVTHEFSGNGSALVTLTAFNDCGEAVFSQTVQFGSLFTFEFSAEAQGNCSPVVVFFENESQVQGFYGLNWVFEGGEPPTSTEENPVITYTLPGTYDVTLQMNNVFGEFFLVKPDLVVVLEMPSANFTFEVTGNVVAFQNESVSGTNFFWDFGDGNTSAEANPTHVFAQSGVYEVSLTVANQGCGSAISQEVGVSTTGIAGAESQVGFRVFPNPAADYFYLENLRALENRRYWRLLNGMGRLLLSGEATGTLTPISTETLPAGIYLLELSNEKNHLYWTILKL